MTFCQQGVTKQSLVGSDPICHLVINSRLAHTLAPYKTTRVKRLFGSVSLVSSSSFSILISKKCQDKTAYDLLHRSALLPKLLSLSNHHCGYIQCQELVSSALETSAKTLQAPICPPTALSRKNMSMLRLLRSRNLHFRPSSQTPQASLICCLVATIYTTNVSNLGWSVPTVVPFAARVSTKSTFAWLLEVGPVCSSRSLDRANILIGPAISSYVVLDKTQVADIDPSMVVDEIYDEPEDRPCPVCRDDDHEEVLLACDGCDAYYHTYCIGLDAVPPGHWFCDNCATQRAIESVNPTSAERPPARAHNPPNRRTRAQQRRVWNRNQATSSNWARVWQSVWDHLNLDLDFPFDEDMEVSSANRVSERREYQEWERRLRVAERQGGAHRFRDTANTLLHSHARRTASPPPGPESQEEIRAWNALEKAREIEAGPSKRKRKSATASPSDAEPTTIPERPLKRPRTRRVPANAPDSSSRDTETGVAAGPSSVRVAAPTPSKTGAPSMLQSMLRKIEETTTNEDSGPGLPTRLSIASANGLNSAQLSSPGSSPTTSNYPTPRARSLTPPPTISPRPSSPLALTSTITPIFPPAQFSPERSPAEPSPPQTQRSDPHRQPRPSKRKSSPPPSLETSPNRASVPLSTKTDLQKMVSTALKPHYQSNAVSKDQYTDINRNVSRLLYDRVGESGYLGSAQKELYERLAFNEVTKAVEGLKAST